MPTHQVLLQGGGGHAKVVLDCLQDQGIDVIGIFDTRLTGNLYGVEYLGNYSHELYPDALMIISIGDNASRMKVAGNTRHGYANAIHSSALVSSRTSMGVGNMILHRAVVQSSTALGNHIIVNTGAQIDHDCAIGDFAHIGPGAVLCGTVTIGTGTFVGAGAVIIPGRRVGSWSVIGAGAVVTKDIPDGVIVAGNPAKIIRTKS